MGTTRKKQVKVDPIVERLRDWVGSPEGQEHLDDAKRRSRERTKNIRDSRVDPKILRIPMTK